MLGDVFKEFGVDVIFNSRAIDLDDLLASFAQSVQGCVLSADNDFFRYRLRNFEIFRDFWVDRGCLLLEPAVQREPTLDRPTPEERDLTPYDIALQCFDPSFSGVFLSEPSYWRGASCSLVKLVGNAHGKVKLLRTALWAQMGVGAPVSVKWPDWDFANDCFAWLEGTENADVSQLYLFNESVDSLIDLFFSGEKRPASVDGADWRNHIFACRSIITELWLRGQPEEYRSQHSLFSLLALGRK